MKMTKKKGFTIVELVIVIAVIAVLAAVLIPTFVTLVNRANNSADTQMVANLNKYLAAMEALDGNNKTMADAMADAADAGYTAGAFTSATNDVVWDQNNDRFLLVKKDDTKILAKADGTDPKVSTDTKHIFWSVYNAVPETQTYSIYYVGTDDNVAVTVGFDAGDKIVDVTYTGDKEVIIKTNANGSEGNLSINTNVGKVKHYGLVHTLTITAAGEYTECGYVYKIETVWNGTFVAEGAQFHQDAEVENETTVKGVKDLVNVTGTADYKKCYANEDDKCLFCQNNLCEHQMSEPSVVPVGCENDGTSFSQCSKCGHVEYIVTSKLGHDYKDIEGFAATCTTAGQEDTKVCTRCNHKEYGAVIQSLMHNWVKEVNGSSYKCDRCGTSLNEVMKKAIRISSDNIDNIDFKGLDKRKDALTVVLDSDITISADKFCELFGTPEIVYWLDSDKSVGGTEGITVSCNGNGIYAVEVILNGYQLTIDSKGTDGRSELGVEAYGYFKITGRDNPGATTAGANTLVLNGKSGFYNSLIHAAVGGTHVMFDGVNVKANYAPICAAYLTDSYEVDGKTVSISPQHITIKNSTLTMMPYTAESTVGEDVTIYIKYGELEDDSKNVPNRAISATYYPSGKEIELWDGEQSEKFNVEYFYIVDAKNNEIKLSDQTNYFDRNVGGIWGIEYDAESGKGRFTIYSCSVAIKDATEKTIKINVTSDAEWYCAIYVDWAEVGQYVTITDSTPQE